MIDFGFHGWLMYSFIGYSEAADIQEIILFYTFPNSAMSKILRAFSKYLRDYRMVIIAITKTVTLGGKTRRFCRSTGTAERASIEIGGVVLTIVTGRHSRPRIRDLQVSQDSTDPGSGWVYSSIGPVPVLFSSWFSTIQGSLNISFGTGPFLGLQLHLVLFRSCPTKSYEYEGF
jgi:hypothetical protein